MKAFSSSRFLFVLLFLFNAGCAVAPFMTPKSGHSLGEGNWQIDAELSPAVGGAVAYGLTEDVDFGVLYEAQFGSVLSAFGKYSFMNNKTGWAASVYGGAFTGAGLGRSSGYYAGPIVSYKSKSVEPYLSVRYSYVNWDVVDVSSGDIDDSVLVINVLDTDITFSYIQTDFGFNYWFSDGFGLNLHGKIWTFIGDDVEADSSSTIFPGVSLLFNL